MRTTFAHGRSSALCKSQTEPDVPTVSALTGHTKDLPPLALPLRGSTPAPPGRNALTGP